MSDQLFAAAERQIDRLETEAARLRALNADLCGALRDILKSTGPNDEHDLPACPFCGGAPFIRMNTWANKQTKGYRVICRDCHASGPIRAVEEKAVAAWRRRITDPARVRAIAAAKAVGIKTES